jgi:hypothetical protein
MVLFASTGAAAGVGVLAFTDNIKSGYDAVERSGRVLLGLGLCINEYAFADSAPGCVLTDALVIARR